MQDSPPAAVLHSQHSAVFLPGERNRSESSIIHFPIPPLNSSTKFSESVNSLEGMTAIFAAVQILPFNGYQEFFSPFFLWKINRYDLLTNINESPKIGQRPHLSLDNLTQGGTGFFPLMLDKGAAPQIVFEMLCGSSSGQLHPYYRIYSNHTEISLNPQQPKLAASSTTSLLFIRQTVSLMGYQKNSSNCSRFLK